MHLKIDLSMNEKIMANKVRLGDYIEVYDRRNTGGLQYLFAGLNKDKIFIPTAADTNGLDNSKYKIVEKETFVFSGMQTGRDKCIRIGLFEEDIPIIVSPAYTTFRVKREHKLLPQYLYLFFNRAESDRYGCFLSDGSIRSNLDWDRFCSIELPLPSIDVQREIVAVYNGLRKIAEENEKLVKTLSEACHAYIVDCRNKFPTAILGDYINVDDCKNKEGHDYPFFGVNKNNVFIPTVADTTKLDNTNYKIVKENTFVFNGMHVGRDIAIPIALFKGDKPIIVSPAYTTFSLNSSLLPEFLLLQLNRTESGRLGWFYCDSSVRGGLEWKRFCEFPIVLPPLSVQEAIVEVYKCAERAKKIAMEARDKMKDLCPALIQKAAHT